jgi:hypothetical protein
MSLANGASETVRPTAETAANAAMPNKPERLEASSADFELALDATLASIDKLMGSTQRAREFARARREILAAADLALKAERRRTVAALTPAQLRKEVRELLDSHEALLDYIDAIERRPRIGEELKRLRACGEIPWPL